MSADTAIRNGLATGFNVLARLFHPDKTVKLAKASEDYAEFDDLYTVADKRFFEFADGRRTLTLNIADTSEALTEAMAKATHVLIDDDLYSIEQGDVVTPDTNGDTWVITGTYFERPARYETL